MVLYKKKWFLLHNKIILLYNIARTGNFSMLTLGAPKDIISVSNFFSSLNINSTLSRLPALSFLHHLANDFLACLCFSVKNGTVRLSPISYCPKNWSTFKKWKLSIKRTMSKMACGVVVTSVYQQRWRLTQGLLIWY